MRQIIGCVVSLLRGCNFGLFASDKQMTGFIHFDVNGYCNHCHRQDATALLVMINTNDVCPTPRCTHSLRQREENSMCDMLGCLPLSGPSVTSSGLEWYCSIGITLRQHCTTWKMERGRGVDDKGIILQSKSIFS